ncbi:GntR family transcriptional regulator [Rhizobium sp. 18055]|jgi:DNA-binding GntR family transcriptional regulator|uniref:GntR family transcriptional regulator n=1 Tax=Rhizobium sp. 18055 TaxID=2681403 RepID=UPI001359B883|nr:GntR family transcriptional regulator [Rhizobium sp. 18055]
MALDRQFHHRNLPDQIADHIVDRLALGELSRGDRLFEKELCDTLNVSRIPLREALRLLQAQGVVRTEPNRGTFIIGFDKKEISEAQEVRLSVERIALRRLLPIVKGRPEILSSLDEPIEQMKRAAMVGDRLEFCRADLLFHGRLIDLSESVTLRPVWEVLSRVTFVFMTQEPVLAYNYAGAIEDHVILKNLIREGRWAPVEKEIFAHITVPMSLRRPA